VEPGPFGPNEHFCCFCGKWCYESPDDHMKNFAHYAAVTAVYKSCEVHGVSKSGGGLTLNQQFEHHIKMCSAKGVTHRDILLKKN
jgi:hypothetical protein